LFDGVLAPGSCFEASAQPFSEFSLCAGNDEILRLRYIFDSEVEKLGGIAYQSEYSGRRWTLQFFRTPYLQRESYKVFCDGDLIVTTNVFRVLRSVEIAYKDGTIWHCYTGITGLEVKDSVSSRLLHTSPRLGLVLGGSTLHIDHEMNLDSALPLLIIFMHSTTHNSH
jgi:hypothetical protein